MSKIPSALSEEMSLCCPQALENEASKRFEFLTFPHRHTAPETLLMSGGGREREKGRRRGEERERERG